MAVETSKPESINREFTCLCPWFADLAQMAIAECNEQGYPIRMFEGYRSPWRQDYLYAQGRTRAGKIVTKARAWQSWHQYGLALDVAFYDGRVWSWDGPWDKVEAIMRKYGFEPLSFERPHFQITGGLEESDAHDIAQKSSMQKVWDLVKSRLKFPIAKAG